MLAVTPPLSYGPQLSEIQAFMRLPDSGAQQRPLTGSPPGEEVFRAVLCILQRAEEPSGGLMGNAL